MPAISSMETSRDTIALIRASFSAPTAIVTDRTAGNATGIEATVRISANCMVSSSGSWRKSAASADHQHEADGHQNEEIADPQHRALEVRDGLRLLDQMGRLAEIGLHPGRGDETGHLALLGDRAGIGFVADLLVDRQRFAGQRRLVDAQIGALDQLQVGRNDVAELRPERRRRGRGAAPRRLSIRRRA